MPGIDTSAAEVTHISAHGIWILIDDEELALPYTEFPWFRGATGDQILTVERPTADHLYWPKLDVDLALASIKNPDAFPLVARSAGQE
jgi:hypothetical protein